MNVDPEIFKIIGHKLLTAMADIARGFDIIATELESGKMPRAQVARLVREAATHATAVTKELSL